MTTQRYKIYSIRHLLVTTLANDYMESKKQETLKQLEIETAIVWMKNGAITITEQGDENTYFINEFGHRFYCKDYSKNWEVIAMEAMKAKANLIAAAPDLLESLKECMEIFGKLYADGNEQTYSKAHKAIAKAEGL